MDILMTLNCKLTAGNIDKKFLKQVNI